MDGAEINGTQSLISRSFQFSGRETYNFEIKQNGTNAGCKSGSKCLGSIWGKSD